MKVLVLSTSSKLRRTRLLWETLRERAPLSLEIVGEGRYPTLAAAASDPGLAAYERVIVDNNLRRLGPAYTSLRRLNNLLILDFDVVQNYLPRSGYRGMYESMLKTLPPHRLVTTGSYAARDLQRKGFDAVYLPKAYDPGVVRNLRQPRDIGFGFIGRTKHRVYTERRRLIRRLQEEVGLRVERTEEGPDYNEMLNRIQVFVVPDLNFPELMIKNFEAMAAGCALVTARQSQEELDALGLVDMENVALYSDEEELLRKLERLGKDPARARRLAEAGQRLVEARHTWKARADGLWAHLQPPLGTPPPLTWTDRWRLMRLTLRAFLDPPDR